MSDNKPVDILPNGKPPSNPIPIEILIDYRKKGLSYSQIAKLTGISKQACNQRLKPLYETLELADAFKNNKSEIFNYKQSRLLNSLDEKSIKSMPPYQRVVAASILYDKQRLEDGLSTSNIDLHSKISDVSDSIKKLQTLIDNTPDE